MQHLSGNVELLNVAGTPVLLECIIEFMFLCCLIIVNFNCATKVLLVLVVTFFFLLLDI
jgi:hypothetical protein